ncbi:transposase, MuDR, MULE transposase domain protein [Tanacetum coccineum]
MNNVHTCPKTQTYPNHRNANKKVIAHILNPKLKDNRRVLKGKDIQKDILSQYKTSISYQQAWRGKEYGLEQIRGSPYESFEMLPYYLHNLERKNKGTVTRIKTDEGVFEMLFIALGASIRTFVNHLRPLLIIDAAHLAFHVVCCRHLMMNIALKKKKTKGLYWKICKAYTPKEFTYNMDILQAVQPDAYHKLIEAGPQRWSRAHCPLIRYNYMTSNSVDSVNACSILNRKLPITMLTETYREMLQKWYFERREVSANMKHEITDWVGDKVHKRKLKSIMWVVNGIDQNLYQVYDSRYNCKVNLMSRSCECCKWQLSGIPCGHVIVVTRFLGLTNCV